MAIAERTHGVTAADGRIAGPPGEGGYRSAESERNLRTHASGMCRCGCSGVKHHAQRHLPGKALAGTFGEQGMQHAGGVAVGACARVVLGIGDDDRPPGAGRDVQGGGDRCTRLEHLQAPLRSRLVDARVQALHGGLRRIAVGPEHRPAFGHVGGRKPGGEAHHHVVRGIERSQLAKDRGGRLGHGGLHIEWQ